MKLSKSYLSYFVFFFFLNISAQHTFLKDTLTPKNKLDTNLQKALQNYEFKKALKIADSMEYLGVSTKDTMFLTYVYDIKCTLFNFNRNYVQGKLYAKKALSIHQQNKNYSLVIGSYSMLATILRKEGKVDSSLYYLHKAKKYLSDTIAINNITFFYNQKALAHLVMGRIDSSLHFSIKRLNYLDVKKDPYQTHFVYAEIANTFFSIKDYKNALLYINKSLELISNDEQFKIINTKALIIKGNIFIKLNKLEEANKNLNAALKVIGDLEMNDERARINIFKAQILKKENKLNKALKQLQLIDYSLKKISNQVLFDLFLTQANIEKSKKNWIAVNNLLNKIKPLINLISDIDKKRNYYKLLIDYYNYVGDFKKGFIVQTKFLEITNKINSQQQIYTIYNLEKKYQLTKKDKEIIQQQLEINKKGKELQEKNTVNNYIIGIAIFLLVASFLLWSVFQQRQKRKNQEIVSLKREFQVKTLESLLEGEEKERLRIAKELHDGVNGDLSAIKYKLSSLIGINTSEIKEAINMINNSCQQIRAISRDLMPPSLATFNIMEAVETFCENKNNLHSETINFHSLGESVTLSKKVELTIFRIIQELVTNSIKHANATEINVQISQRENILQINVEDNGGGYDVTNLKKNGMGLKNIQSRVDSLKASIDIISNKKGSSCTIDINTNIINDH